MTGLCWPTERAQLVVGGCLKLVLRHETKALKLSPRHTTGLSLVVPFQSIHCIGVHRMVRKQNAVEILNHRGYSDTLCLGSLQSMAIHLVFFWTIGTQMAMPCF